MYSQLLSSLSFCTANLSQFLHFLKSSSHFEFFHFPPILYGANLSVSHGK